MEEGIYGTNLISQNPTNLGTEKQSLTEHSPSLTGSPCVSEGFGLACLPYFIAGREMGNLLLYKSYHPQHK